MTLYLNIDMSYNDVSLAKTKFYSVQVVSHQTVQFQDILYRQHGFCLFDVLFLLLRICFSYLGYSSSVSDFCSVLTILAPFIIDFAQRSIIMSYNFPL